MSPCVVMMGLLLAGFANASLDVTVVTRNNEKMKKDVKSILFIFLPLKLRLGRLSTEIYYCNVDLVNCRTGVQNEAWKKSENL